MASSHSSRHRQQASRVIALETAAIAALDGLLDEQFDQVVDAILASRGKLVICGMGKSGLIGQKIAATLASTGTPSFFLHPGEAWHGDLGMIGKDDLFLAISNSGETEELIRLVPFLQANGNIWVAMTGKPASTLARNANFHLSIGTPEEACPLSLAPTSSTTAALVMGDALAIAAMVARGFQPEDFARFHPGGSLGRKLLTRVRDRMRAEDLPVVSPEDSAAAVIQKATRGRLGLVVVVAADEVCGLITDGDLRRALEKYGDQFLRQSAGDIMTRSPRVIAPSASLQEAQEVMTRHAISALLVMEGRQLAGVIQLYQCEL